jgi:uncharacterized repeat protein (TIGR03803 family)
MERNSRRFRTLLAALLVTITTALVLPPGSSAQSKFRTLYKFKGGTDGRSPFGGVVSDSAGNLYGTAGGGSTNCYEGCGVVFTLTPNSNGNWSQSVLYSFCPLSGCLDGGVPAASLVFDGEGNLYSTTTAGGSTGNGTVFKLTHHPDGTWTESVLYSFAGGPNDGSDPIGGLIFDNSGSLYGTTRYGGNTLFAGTVFKLTPNGDGSWSESVLYKFCSLANCPDGEQPEEGVTLDGAGNLYGTTTEGGLDAAGTVFELTPHRDRSWSQSVLHRFCSLKKCRDGIAPYDSLIFDQTGNLYGTTSGGGSNRGGTVFKLTPKAGGGWTESALHNFCTRTNCSDGNNPFAGLNFDAAGNLYGTTYYGGNTGDCAGSGCGVVFKLTPNSKGGWHETVLHAFIDHAGARPFAGLMLDAAGNLYGTTSGDGDKTFGSVFEITP